jgi:hypothetical protein
MRPSLLSGCAAAALASSFLMMSTPAAAQTTPVEPEDAQTDQAEGEQDAATNSDGVIIITAQRRAEAHRFPETGPFERAMQVAELEYIAGSPVMRTAIAENYVGLPL